MVRPSFGNKENKKTKKEKPSKKDKKASADAPPPLFSHHNTNELLRGHKSPQQRKSSKVKINPHLMQIPAFKGGGDESEYYEEEVVEESEYLEEEIIEEEILEEPMKPVLPELPPRETTIRFEEFDEMLTVLHINDYTNHEISKTWFKREEYSNMSNLARKTVNKAEERLKEIENSKTKKGHKVIECRGLEAWTTEGAAATKLLKERAIEAVFYEQCRQWDDGISDVEKIRDVYRAVSMGAQQIANDRATSDETIVAQLLAKEKAELEEKLSKEKSKRSKLKKFVGKATKKTAGGVAKTAKLTGKVTKKTGKVALGTAVATATLDRKMLKETVKSIPKKKKRECEHQVVHTPSQSSQATNPNGQDHGRLIPVLVTDDSDEDESNSEFGPRSSRFVDPSSRYMMNDHSSRRDNNGNTESERAIRVSEMSMETKKKKKKLKLLGVAPIPGTEKKYKQDKRKKKIEKRQQKHSNLPAWEQAGLSSGKY